MSLVELALGSVLWEKREEVVLLEGYHEEATYVVLVDSGVAIPS